MMCESGHLGRAIMKGIIESGQLEGYIFNRNNMTKDDKMVAIRRTVTCENTFPYVIELGNDYCIQYWYGDYTKSLAYQEYDDRY